MGAMKATSPMKLAPNERVSRIAKEHHVRKQKNGRYVAYIVEDKFAQHLLLGQKLSSLVDAINELVPDKPDRVSLPGLYQSMGSKSERTGAYTKYRWKIHPYDIDEAADAFESVRSDFREASVIGTPECYDTIVV